MSILMANEHVHNCDHGCVPVYVHIYVNIHVMLICKFYHFCSNENLQNRPECEPLLLLKSL
jgi:hypothetical protein